MREYGMSKKKRDERRQSGYIGRMGAEKSDHIERCRLGNHWPGAISALSHASVWCSICQMTNICALISSGLHGVEDPLPA